MVKGVCTYGLVSSSVCKVTDFFRQQYRIDEMESHMLSLGLLLLVGLTAGEVIKIQKCYLPAATQKSCVIHEVRLDPCPEAANDKPCKIKLGTNISFSFDYTPTFSAASMESMVYRVNAVIDTPLEVMDTNGCKYTTCPVEANKKQVYVYNLTADTKAPAGIHQSKLMLWNSADRTQQCCFKAPLEVVR